MEKNFQGRVALVTGGAQVINIEEDFYNDNSHE